MARRIERGRVRTVIDDQTDYRALAIEILDELVSTAGYVGDYFWEKWYVDLVARYRKELGLDAQDAPQAP